MKSRTVSIRQRNTLINESLQYQRRNKSNCRSMAARRLHHRACPEGAAEPDGPPPGPTGEGDESWPARQTAEVRTSSDRGCSHCSCGLQWFRVRLAAPEEGSNSHVVVHLELMRVRAHTDGIDFVGALVVDPGLDQSGVKTPHWSRNSWSDSRLSMTFSSDPGTWGIDACSSGKFEEVLVNALVGLVS